MSSDPTTTNSATFWEAVKNRLSESLEKIEKNKSKLISAGRKAEQVYERAQLRQALEARILANGINGNPACARFLEGKGLGVNQATVYRWRNKEIDLPLGSFRNVRKAIIALGGNLAQFVPAEELERHRLFAALKFAARKLLEFHAFPFSDDIITETQFDAIFTTAERIERFAWKSEQAWIGWFNDFAKSDCVKDVSSKFSWDCEYLKEPLDVLTFSGILRVVKDLLWDDSRASNCETEASDFVGRTIITKSQVDQLRCAEDSEPSLQSTAEVTPTRLQHSAERLIGRDADLMRLHQTLADGHKNVVVIRAWAGVGKTSLVVEWMAELALKGWCGVERVFDWSFYSQGTRQDGEGDKVASADAFITEALKFFGDLDPIGGSPWDRGARLARLVGERKALLVLDGLEPLQQPPGPLAGQIKDPSIGALLKGLAGKNEGLCIVTTRERIEDLKSFYGKTADDWELSHLSEDAGEELLRVLGVLGTVQERCAASREVRGHALTLHLMGRYLALAHHGDIRKCDLFEFSEADNVVQGGHAFRVLRAYETWLASNGEAGRRQLAILRLLCLFDRPADPLCLAALRQQPAILGLTEDVAGISDVQWNIAVKRLEEIGLITSVEFKQMKVKGYSRELGLARLEERESHLTLPDPEEFRSSSLLLPSSSFSLDAHPLLREHFAKQLRATEDSAWREGHQRLFSHLQASVPYWPVGVDGLGPLYQAVAHGCHAGLEQTVCTDIYRDRILWGTGKGGFYSTKKLGAIGADLGAVACFFTKPWSMVSANLSPTNQSWLLNEAALRLRGVGRLSEAVEPMRVGLEMAVAQKDWRNAAIYASNLSGLELTLGEVLAALVAAKQSVDYADRSQDALERMGRRSVYANVLHQSGQPEDALPAFREAEDMQAERQPMYPRLYSLWGFRYCDLLLVDAERAAWRVTMASPPAGDVRQLQAICESVAERADYARKIANRESWLLDIGLDHLTAARAALYRALLDSVSLPVRSFHSGCPSSMSCDAAVDCLRRSGRSDHLPRGLLTRAWLRFVMGDVAGCRGELAEAWEVAEHGEMRLFMADILLSRGRFFRDPLDLVQARTLIEQCHYYRRNKELADGEASLQTK